MAELPDFRYFDLGNHVRPVVTTSEHAQRWFNRGLNWCYGFNHDEAISCFNHALDHDPACAMAWWGVAYAHGPFYNKPWEFYGNEELPAAIHTCYRATRQALRCSERSSPVEQALIQALARRYQSDQALSLDTLTLWDDDYALAMGQVYEQFPEDLDVVALYAEAMMTRTPWRLWDISTGLPAAGADTERAIAVLERGMQYIEEQELDSHPGILHMYIHAMEMSPHPERALPVADRLRNLMPDSGHLQHMPAHIDVLCGQYHEAVAASDRAIAADRKYLEQLDGFNFYILACCHDFHLKMYAAMFLGQHQAATAAAGGIHDLVTDEALRSESRHVVSTLEGYYSMGVHVPVRFGRWQEIIDQPMPADPALYPVTTCMQHYAKGIALAATGHISDAEEERRLFEYNLERISEERRFFNNSARDVLAVAAAMLNGELEYRKANYDLAFDHLRRAVELDDRLHYSEPWPWMHPPRHALGALLLEQHQVDDAEAVYRADLGLDDTLNRPAQHPDNVWSLHGYVECLNRLGRREEARSMQVRLDQALAWTDTEIIASCACRLHPANLEETN